MEKEVCTQVKQRKRFLALLLAGAIATGSFTGALAFTEEQVKDSTTEAVNRLEDTAELDRQILFCLLYTSPSPRDA